jgi:hypothetical protein
MKNELDQFRKAFAMTRCHAEEDFLSYKVLKGRAKEVATEANKLIEQLGLSLSAIPTNLSSQDSICVQSSEIGYI